MKLSVPSNKNISLKQSGDFLSLVDLAQGGRDMNSVLSDALVLASNSTPVLGILTKMTLDVLASPMKEFMEEGRQESILEINSMKFYGVNRFKEWYNFNRNRSFFANEYDFLEISYQAMQDLLNGTLKKQQELKYAYNEVIVFYKKIDGNMIIDSFFIKEHKL